jgi:Lrp/AsnC family transcriptional regulator for asnA, asnC and gidA
MKIDKIDEKIINEMIENAKSSLREIATKTKTSFVTVMNRIKRLEKEGVIEKYTAKINYRELGYGVNVLIEVRIAKGKLFELEKKIASSQNVYAVYDTTGEYDATILAKFKNTKQLDEFVKKLQTFEFIERTNTKLMLNIIKEAQIKI